MPNALNDAHCHFFSEPFFAALGGDAALATLEWDAPGTAEFFEKEVRPLLAARCLQCHGEGKAKGGELRRLRGVILPVVVLHKQ